MEYNHYYEYNHIDRSYRVKRIKESAPIGCLLNERFFNTDPYC